MHRPRGLASALPPRGPLSEQATRCWGRRLVISPSRQGRGRRVEGERAGGTRRSLPVWAHVHRRDPRACHGLAGRGGASPRFSPSSPPAAGSSSGRRAHGGGPLAVPSEGLALPGGPRPGRLRDAPAHRVAAMSRPTARSQSSWPRGHRNTEVLWAQRGSRGRPRAPGGAARQAAERPEPAEEEGAAVSSQDLLGLDSSSHESLQGLPGTQGWGPGLDP